MAHKIVIDGEIGWDVTAKDVRSQLSEAKGRDIEVELSSVGGSVFEGITVHNLIKNYEGKSTVNISSLAASMGSYIALAGDEVTVSGNSVFMIHNAWGFSGGDHKDLKKAAKLLEGFSGLLNETYAEKTGKSSEEIASLMDEETWFFGSEIVDAGFADSIIGGEVKGDKDEAVLAAMLKVEACNAKLRQEEYKEDLNKAAALFKPPTTTAPKAKTTTPPKENMSVDLDAPEVVAALAKAKEEGIAEAKAQAEPKEAEPVKNLEGKALALSVLKSESYSAKVKEYAAKAIESELEGDYVTFNAVLAVADMHEEEIKSAVAKAESEGIGETPGEQPEESGIDKNGVVVNAKGLKELGAQLKAVQEAQAGGK